MRMGGGVSGDGEPDTRFNVYVCEGPSGESITGGSGMARNELSSLGSAGVLPGTVLTLPHCFSFSSLSPFEIGMMLSTVILVRTGLGTNEPEAGGF